MAGDERSPTEDRSATVGGSVDRSFLATGDHNKQAGRDLNEFHLHLHAGSAPATQNRWPPLRPPYASLPRPATTCIGRETDLQRLHAALVGGADPVALMPGTRPATVAAHGGGGIGKTRLALEYAWRYRDQYPGGAFLVTVEKRQPLEVWAEVGRLLFEGDQTSDEQSADDALTWLARTDLPCTLVVLDDIAPSGAPGALKASRFARSFELRRRPAPALPNGPGVHVLMTTRLTNLPGIRPIEIDRLSADAAEQLLLERSARRAPSDRQELHVLRALVDTDLGGHALGLSLAGAYLHKVPSLSFAAYRERIRDQGATAILREAARRAGDAITDHEQCVVATFALSHALIASPLARALLEAAAFLAPGVPIDRPLLARLIGEDPTQPTPEALDLALSELIGLGLLTAAAGEHGAVADVNVHTLTADYVRWGISTERRVECEDKVAAGLRALFPNDRSEYWRILQRGGGAGWETLTPAREQHSTVALRRLAPRGRTAKLALALAGLEEARGDMALTRAHAEHARDISLRLCGQDPANTSWQRDVSVSQLRIGDVLLEQGDLAGALREYQGALEISARLCGQDPANTSWQRDVSVSQERIGDVLREQGDLAGALREYRGALEISARLCGQDPENATWQRDVSWSRLKIGDVLREQGDLAGTLREYRGSLEIFERLCERDPENASWQRDVSVGQERIGDVLREQGDLAGALREYRGSLEISARLCGQDPENASWQRDVSVSRNKVGDVLLAQGDLAGALREYRGSLKISARLCERDPENASWQRDVSVSRNKVGDVLLAQGDLAGALREYRGALKISARLCERDPENASWQRDVSVSRNKVGDVLLAQGDWAGALREYRGALEISARLCERDPENASWQLDLAIACWKMFNATDRSTAEGRSEARDLLKRGLRVLRALESNTQLPHRALAWPQVFASALADIERPQEVEMTNDQDKARSDRSVRIGGSVHGSSIVTGDHNKVVTHTSVQHPPAESVDIRAELAAIRAALAELQAPDRDRLDNALKEAEDEAARDKPRPDEIGDALGRAVKYASRAAGFAAAMDRLRPHVTNAAAWLGTHGSTLLRTLGL